MERLLAQIALRVHARAADRWSLPVLSHDGAEPQLQQVLDRGASLSTTGHGSDSVLKYCEYITLIYTHPVVY